MAIVVPDAEVLEPWARNNGIEGDIKQLCENKVKHFFLNFPLNTLRIRTGYLFSQFKWYLKRTMEGNPRQSCIPDSTQWIPDSRYWIPNFPTLNKMSLMKTKIIVLKDVNSKYPIACSTEQLLVFDNSPVLLGPNGKRPQKATHSHGNCVLWIPPPLGISVARRERGMDIFWIYIFRIQNARIADFTSKIFRISESLTCAVFLTSANPIFCEKKSQVKNWYENTFVSELRSTYKLESLRYHDGDGHENFA